MKKRIHYFFIVQLFVLAACSPKIVSFKVNNNGKPISYMLSIPKGYKTLIENYENERVKRFLYADSSSIFFSDNVTPSAFYPDAYLKYGKDLNIKFLASDTITINGKDDKGKYWEDRKIKHIVYGYRKVPSDKKEMFDQILDSIVIK
jgi:hypothetical protein